MFFYHLANKFLVLLLAGALCEIGIKAKSFMNWQIPILTEGSIIMLE